MVSATRSVPPSISERSEKNSSWLMLSAARSARIMSIIMAIALARAIGSHSASGIVRSRSPCSAFSASPTGLR